LCGKTAYLKKVDWLDIGKYSKKDYYS